MNKILLLLAFMATSVLGVAMPQLNYEDNTMVLSNLNPEPGDEPTVLPLRCAFYNETSQYLDLYLCVGELYETEGGAFYSDDLYDTRFIEVMLPWNRVGTETSVDGENAVVGFYDMLADDWVFIADEGTLLVKTTNTEHIYDVELQVADHTNNKALGAHMCQTDEWRWRDYTEERPVQNEFTLTKNGEVVDHHEILSCVVDESNPQLPVFYLADQPNLSTIEAVQALNLEQYVIIQMPTSLMDGLMKGFSGWSDDNLTVTYKGINYNHSGCLHDETCYGGNVAMIDYNHDTKHIEVNSMIFTMVQDGYRNMNLHYDGSFVVNGEVGISNLDAPGSEGPCYNLWGHRTNHATNGVIISNGKKQIIEK